jgi:NAD(P)-dependent dehydrogenase (short-subunit alcohol dehydrogenase family)
MGERNGKRFGGKAVIVTGAGSGIGRQTAVQFAREGGRVVVADIDADGAKQTAELIQAEDGDARVSVTDVSDAAAVESMVAETVAAYGRLDVLHNNAYWAPLRTTVTQTTLEQWNRTMAVTLTGVFLGCKFAIPRMTEAGGGVIVNTTAMAAHAAGPAFAAYTAAKGGVLALTRSIAVDYGQFGIRCNAVSPGLINTPATAAVFANPDHVGLLLERIHVGRHGEPTDIANAVLFVASDEASFMTGQALVIDGGRLAC